MDYLRIIFLASLLSVRYLIFGSIVVHSFNNQKMTDPSTTQPKSPSYSVWLVLDDQSSKPVRTVMEKLKHGFKSPDFTPHITLASVPAELVQEAADKAGYTKDSRYVDKYLLDSIKRSVETALTKCRDMSENIAKKELLERIRQVTFSSVFSEPNFWAQDVVLEVNESAFLKHLNFELKSDLGAKNPGEWAPPSKKPHMSLVYADNGHEASEQIKMQEIVNSLEGDAKIVSPTENTFRIAGFLVMRTAGGFQGISNWGRFDVHPDVIDLDVCIV